MKQISVILHNIRSSENVGSIFRTADAAGISKIYLTGYTPAPLDRFKRTNGKLSKAALGAEDFVPWETHADIQELIATLKASGMAVVGVEQSLQSIPYIKYRIPDAAAFIFGNEVDGVPEAVLAACDSIIEIPMHGQKESLNVAVSAGIVLFNAIND